MKVVVDEMNGSWDISIIKDVDDIIDTEVIRQLGDWQSRLEGQVSTVTR